MPKSRHELYEAVQMMLAGERSGTCIEALIDSLASAIGFASGSLTEADSTADRIPADLKRAIRDNWEYFSELRAQHGATGRA